MKNDGSSRSKRIINKAGRKSKCTRETKSSAVSRERVVLQKNDIVQSPLSHSLFISSVKTCLLANNMMEIEQFIMLFISSFILIL